MQQDKKLTLRLRIAGILALVSVPILIMVVISLNVKKPIEFPIFGQLPEFHLTEENGAPFSSADVEGKTWVAGFFFTTCHGQCPMLISKMKRVQSELGDIQSFRLIGFTVDPKTDTPEVLKAYARKHGIDEKIWSLLTGPEAEIRFLAQHGFRLSAGGGADETIAHSFRLVLMDPHARIRGYYDGLSDDEVDRLIRDARMLATDKSEARIRRTAPIAAGLYSE